MGLLLVLGQVGDDLRQVFHAVVDHAHEAPGVAAVAAAVADRRGFQDDDGRAVLARGERRAARGVAGADHDHVGLSKIGSAHCIPFRTQGFPVDSRLTNHAFQTSAGSSATQLGAARPRRPQWQAPARRDARPCASRVPSAGKHWWRSPAARPRRSPATVMCRRRCARTAHACTYCCSRSWKRNVCPLRRSGARIPAPARRGDARAVGMHASRVVIVGPTAIIASGRPW